MDQYKCQHCNQEFQNQDELQRHNQQQHQQGQQGQSQGQIGQGGQK